MAANHGKNQVLKVGIAVGGGTITDVSSYVGGSAVAFSREQPALETTTLGDGSRTFIKDLRNGSFSAEFEFDNTMVDYLEIIYSDDTTEVVSCEYFPTSETTGASPTNNKYAFSAILTNYNVTGPIGLMSVATDWQVSGAVVKTELT
jgi:hypothetical protein